MCVVFLLFQKQPSRGIPKKRFSENMQQIYKRTYMPKCDFIKVAKQHLFLPKNTSGGAASVISTLKGIIMFLSQIVHASCWLKIWNMIKTKRNRKWKIPQIFLERRTLYFSSYKKHELKVKLWRVEARERKKNPFF